MNFGLSLRFWIAKWCFSTAQVVAGWMLHKPKLPAWEGALSLPAVGDVGRVEQVAASRKQYDLVDTSRHFGISVQLEHETLRDLPKAEAYPARLTASKAFLKGGFAMDVSSGERWASFDAIRVVYGRLGVPSVAARWRSDDEFVRQRLQGPNPIWIEKLDSKVAATLDLAAMGVMDAQGEHYVVDFRGLMQGAFGSDGRFCYPCAAVFQLREGTLRALAIQLERPDGTHAVATPADGAAWMLAKMFFQCADIWVHEVVTHYLWCHVYLEKIILATHRNLAPTHPLRRLLALHFEHTLNLNRNGLVQLMGNGGYFDEKFSPGAAGKVAAVAFGNREWAFWRMEMPEHVTRRQVAGLPEYPWRDDGLLACAEVERFVGEFVAGWYRDDGAVVADTEVQAWSLELQARMGDRGFPALDGVANLCRVLTASLFQVVQHDLVNAPQFEWYGFPPSSPPILCVPFPADKTVVTEQTLVEALPDVGITLNAILATYGFSTRYNAWGDHAGRYLAGPSLATYERFLDRLRAAELVLAERNAKRAVPYVVALPSRLSLSISA